MSTTLDVPFHLEHSQAGYVYLNETETTRYFDGAILQGKGVMSVMRVPADEAERARLIAIAYHAAVEQAVKKFREKQKELGMWAGAVRRDGGNVPPPETLEQLKALKADVDKLRAGLAEAQAKAEASKPDWMKQQQAAKAQQQAAAGEYMQQLSQIGEV